MECGSRLFVTLLNPSGFVKLLTLGKALLKDCFAPNADLILQNQASFILAHSLIIFANQNFILICSRLLVTLHPQNINFTSRLRLSVQFGCVRHNPSKLGFCPHLHKLSTINCQLSTKKYDYCFKFSNPVWKENSVSRC